MSYLLPHLHSGWAVDQAILDEKDRLVIIRFGRDWTPECMVFDEVPSSSFQSYYSKQPIIFRSGSVPTSLVASEGSLILGVSLLFSSPLRLSSSLLSVHFLILSPLALSLLIYHG